MGSAASKYEFDKSLPKPLASYETRFYGRMTPSSPDGEDLGLKEVFACWHFETTNDQAVHILPEWEQVKMCGLDFDHSWNHKAFDPRYQSQLQAYGITESDYNEIVARLNKVLEGFAPFTQDTNIYITEFRRHLTKLNLDFPKSKWELQIHKYASELSSVLFFENVLHRFVRLSCACFVGWSEIKRGTYFADCHACLVIHNALCLLLLQIVSK